MALNRENLFLTIDSTAYNLAGETKNEKLVGSMKGDKLKKLTTAFFSEIDALSKDSGVDFDTTMVMLRERVKDHKVMKEYVKRTSQALIDTTGEDAEIIGSIASYAAEEARVDGPTHNYLINEWNDDGDYHLRYLKKIYGDKSVDRAIALLVINGFVYNTSWRFTKMRGAGIMIIKAREKEFIEYHRQHMTGYTKRMSKYLTDHPEFDEIITDYFDVHARQPSYYERRGSLKGKNEEEVLILIKDHWIFVDPFGSWLTMEAAETLKEHALKRL